MTEVHPWHRFVFTLVLPDAIRRQVHGRIVARIEQAGYRIAYFELLQVHPEQLDQLYNEQISNVWDAYRYRLLDRLWALGPVIGLVLEDVSGSAEDPHTRMQALKGATDPARAAPGTIRRDFGGINAILSFVHAADRPEVSAREAGMLFSAKVCEAGPPRADVADGTSEVDAHAVLALLATPVVETRGFPEVLAEHRARVISAAWADLSPAARSLAAAATERRQLGEVGLGSRLADGLRGGTAHPAAALLGAEWRPGLPALSERALLSGCAALGLERDTWAEIVLLSCAYFPPNRHPVTPTASHR